MLISSQSNDVQIVHHTAIIQTDFFLYLLLIAGLTWEFKEQFLDQAGVKG